jgi:ribosome maturation factor RimP
MLYRAKKDSVELARLRETVEPVAAGLGCALVELTLSRHRGSCQVRAVITGTDNAGTVGTNELGRLHKALLPRLELALGSDISVELSSPGIGRVVKEGAEFTYFVGRPVRCYLGETSDWVTGILKARDENKIILESGDGEIELEYERIAKAILGD